jgi:molybdate transport system substrate-binding protein
LLAHNGAAAVKKLALLLLLLFALLAGVAALHRHSASDHDHPIIAVFCAASLKSPVEKIAEEFRRETGVEVELQIGGSGALLSSLRVAKRGDLFLAADNGFTDDARQAGIVSEVFPIVVQHPVIIVRKGNPKHIAAVADLLRDDVKLALADPASASISRVSKDILKDRWTRLATHATVMKPSVTEVATDVNLGAVDAAIVWDSVVAQFKDTMAIEVPDLSSHKENASACTLNFSTQAAEALQFARYLTTPEKGGVIFKANGFVPAELQPATP